MLKWTSTTKISDSQKFTTPQKLQTNKRSVKRRATINPTLSSRNDENQLITSTPLQPRLRSSPLVLAPLADVLNITPERTIATTPERRRTSFTRYASTLPRYQEEEYSPTTLPTGHMLAMRGLIRDPFLQNPRYLDHTPEIRTSARKKRDITLQKSSRKRKLELDYSDRENCSAAATKENKSLLSSSKMGDFTLDCLIDAILESTKKDKTKRRRRKSLNLRRRTLIKNTAELVLSPSYTPAEDPASDLSFSECKRFKSSPSENPLKEKKISVKNIAAPKEAADATAAGSSKNYFEVGLALPSIYV